MPFEATGKLAHELIAGSRLEVYAGAPHATCTTHRDRVNADLLGFVQG